MRTSRVGYIQTHMCRYNYMRASSHRLLFFRGRYYNIQDKKKHKRPKYCHHNAYNISTINSSYSSSGDLNAT